MNIAIDQIQDMKLIKYNQINGEERRWPSHLELKKRES